MLPSLSCNGSSSLSLASVLQNSLPRSSLFHPRKCFSSHKYQKFNTVHNLSMPRTHLTSAIMLPSTKKGFSKDNGGGSKGSEANQGFSQEGFGQMLALCGSGYWVQGFRCFPWLALNYHMAHSLKLHPSTLQLVQYAGNLPMVAKPLYGVLSDALYIGGAHRIPYICIGVLLQILAWGPLAVFPVAGGSLPTLIAGVLLSNLGASVAEVAKDALVAEYGQRHKMGGLQSYSFMALAFGGVLGNLIGGFILMKTHPRTMFLLFSVLLSIQLAVSLSIKEDSLGLMPPVLDGAPVKRSILEGIRHQFNDLLVAIRGDNISLPLVWIVASIATVPMLSGSIFCYQTQCLGLDPSIIGMSRVVSQLLLLSTTVLYNQFWKNVPMRKLIQTVQVMYALSLLLDLVLVKQINVSLGIPNGVFALCFSGVAETIAQFKILPFMMLFSSLCPPGSEGSLTSFLASALCLSSVVSGFLGIGLSSLIGITSRNYSSLPLGIVVQFIAALLPLRWIRHLPMSEPVAVKERKRGQSRKLRRNRRVGRVHFGPVSPYRCKVESERLR